MTRLFQVNVTSVAIYILETVERCSSGFALSLLCRTEPILGK